jgi:predicted transcriptional regulator of viral defense system
MKPSSVNEFVDDLQKRARYTFARKEVEAALKLERAALTKGLQRLQKAGRIRMIRRGFYVVVPLEYAASGIVPPDWFIDDLMKFLEQPYYVGVLTAASMQGASHQQPQEYQVVVARPERAIRTANLNIRYFLKKSMARVPVERVKAYTGFLAVSTPAVTALDLVRFAPAIGGLDAVVTVLEELVEKITPEDLLNAARHESERSQVQRLGWLLERTKRCELADGLAMWLAAQKPAKTPLDVSAPVTGCRKDPRWQVIVNAKPQSEA